jgi:hypothetical protein
MALSPTPRVYSGGKAAPTSGDPAWQSWFCQVIGESLSALAHIFKERRVCACGRHVIDESGDHIHSCKQHTGSTKAAHETILDAVETLCRQVGIETERRNIPSIKTRNGKSNWTGRLGAQARQCDSQHIGGYADLILDVALIHEFGGNHMADDVSRNGNPRNDDPSKLLEATARTNVRRYREAPSCPV